MLYRSNQREPCRRVLTELQNKYGVTHCSKMINAALHLKMGDVTRALEVKHIFPKRIFCYRA